METADIYQLVKSLHIIFVVTWFAGLFYIVRLFVNHTEALQKPEPERSILIEQFRKMERPLWIGITWPSMIMTVTFGTIMFFMQPNLIKMPYMHLKLTLVALLIGYHHYCGVLYKKYKQHIPGASSFALRILNEVASVFLVGIVIVVEMAHRLNVLYFILGIILFCLILLFVIIRFWNKRNTKN